MSNIILFRSSGVGRTGCFITIDVLLEEAKRKGSVDVVACISKLMEQRPYMIQSAVIKTLFGKPNCVIGCS